MLYSSDSDNNNISSGDGGSNAKSDSRMNESDRLKLQRHYRNLLEVSYSTISAHLISNFIIDLEMHADIEALPTDKKKIEKLLTILPSRGNRALVELINALKPNYSWVADRLSDNHSPTTNVLNDFNSNGTIHNCNIIGNGTSTSRLNNDGFPSTSSTLNYGNSENLRDIQISKYLKPIARIMQTSSKLSQYWNLLAHSMGIDPCTLNDIKRQMNYEGGTAYAINTTLDAWISKIGPSKATFAHLTSITENEGYNDVTEALIDLWKTLQ